MTNSPAIVSADSASVPAQVIVRRLRWLDALIVLVLVLAALPPRFAKTSGDLWFDEAEYAVAGTGSLAANRWDRSDDPKTPDKMLRLHHYHPPLTAELVGLAARFGTDDRTLRTPFVLAGGLVVGLVYGCGLFLFAAAPDEWLKRVLAAACALVTLATPAQIRQSSHAIPWILITLWSLLLLWTLLGYARTRKPGWIAGAGAALGGFWVTSEMALLLAPLVLGVLGWLLWPVFRPVPPPKEPDFLAPDTAANGQVGDAPATAVTERRTARRKTIYALLLGAAAFLIIGAICWPIGLGPHALAMLLHYTGIRDLSIPVTLHNQTYANAPKWAYAYWFYQRYLPYLVWYVLGFVGLLALALRRRFDIAAAILTAFTGLLLAITHKAHIIGPEYIAHCLPFLTLCGGGFFLAVATWNRIAGLVLLVLLSGRIALWQERMPLAGMEARDRISRWPAAAQFLADRWHPNDKLAVGPQPPPVPRWYLMRAKIAPMRPDTVTQLAYRDTKDISLQKIASGYFRFIAVSSTVVDNPTIDPRLQKLIKPRFVWQSAEPISGPSRLVLYEIPPGSLTFPVSRPKSAPKPLPAPVLDSGDTPPGNDETDAPAP